MPTSRAVNSIFAALERHLLLPGLGIDFSQRESSLKLNGILLNGGARRILEGKECRAIDMVFPILCGFIDHVTGYAKSPKMTKVHAMYSLLMSSVGTGIW